jgi:hypothetical protein
MNKTLWSMIGLGVLLTACEKPTTIGYANVCNRDNDGKLIETTGYLNDGNGVFCSNTRNGTMECSFTLVEKPHDEKGISADISVGTSANTAEELKSNYAPEDVKIRDNNGELISPAQKLRVTGRLQSFADKTDPSEGGCYLTVKTIKRL